jgi:glycosyltransferase involved in cell wall biosynthesis
VPNGIQLSEYVSDFGQPLPDTLVYAGSLTYRPNFEAMAFFLREIFPAIRAERPNVKLLVTGKPDGQAQAALPSTDGVVFTGYLPDVRPTVAQSWVSLAPLLAGGGTRVKILESLALGTPVVATTKGAEGLEFVSGRELLIADQPSDFAEAVLSLLRDVGLRRRMSQAGRQGVKQKYDWDEIGQGYRRLVDTLARGTGGAR